MVLLDSCKAPRTPHYSGFSRKSDSFSHTRLSRSLGGLSIPLLLTISFVTSHWLSHDPNEHAHWFRLFPRSLAATDGITDLFSFPSGTEMVHFPEFALPDLCIQSGVTGDASRVPPFGNLRVKGCLHLTEAYRSLPRPSSPTRAKASTVCP